MNGTYHTVPFFFFWIFVNCNFWEVTSKVSNATNKNTYKFFYSCSDEIVKCNMASEDFSRTSWSSDDENNDITEIEEESDGR